MYHSANELLLAIRLPNMSNNRMPTVQSYFSVLPLCADQVGKVHSAHFTLICTIACMQNERLELTTVHYFWLTQVCKPNLYFIQNPTSLGVIKVLQFTCSVFFLVSAKSVPTPATLPATLAATCAASLLSSSSPVVLPPVDSVKKTSLRTNSRTGQCVQ